MWTALKKWSLEHFLLPLIVAVGGGWALWHLQHQAVLTAELSRELDARLRGVAVELADQPAAKPLKLAAAAEQFAVERGLPLEPVQARQRELLARWDAAEESLQRGLVLVQARRYEAARREFVSASQSDPENPAAWSNLGAVDLLLGRIDEGRNAYDRALALAPDDAVMRYNFGLFFVRTANLDAAAAQLTRAFASPVLRGDARLREMLLADLRDNPLLADLRQRPELRILLEG
jgi:tetratricopeptide (TPR) repeat protein